MVFLTGEGEGAKYRFVPLCAVAHPFFGTGHFQKRDKTGQDETKREIQTLENYNFDCFSISSLNTKLLRAWYVDKLALFRPLFHNFAKNFKLEISFLMIKYPLKRMLISEVFEIFEK